MLVTDDERVADRVRHLATQAREPAAPLRARRGRATTTGSPTCSPPSGGPSWPTSTDGWSGAARSSTATSTALGDLPGVGVHARGTRRAGRNRWLTCLTIDPRRRGHPAEVREHLEALDIEARPTWKPMHLQPVFADCPGRLDGTSARLFEPGLCLPERRAP